MRAPKLASRRRSRLAVTVPSGRSAMVCPGTPGRAQAQSSALRSSAWRCAPRSQSASTSEAASARMAMRSVGGLGEARLGRLDHVEVALPAFVLQLDVLDRYRVGVRVEVGQRLV